MRRIAVINQKGGVGKTTSCCNIAAAIAAAGQSVLLIDLDPQAHLTMHLGIEPHTDTPSIYNVLTDGVPIQEAALEVSPRLGLVPSHIDLAAAEMELVSIMGREVILRDALHEIDPSYDFVMIDCPPSLGVLTINGLAAMNEVFVPMQPHFLALQGLGKLLETIRLVKHRINPDVAVTGILLCLYEAGTRLAGEVAADLAAFLETSRGTDVPWAEAQIFRTIIRRNIKLAECPSHGQTIFEYAPNSNGAIDYGRLAAEVLGVENLVIERSPGRRAEQAPRTPPSPVTPADQSEDANKDALRPEPLETQDRVAFGPDDVEPAEAEPFVPAQPDTLPELIAPVQHLPPPAPPPAGSTRIPIEYDDELQNLSSSPETDRG